MKDLIRALIDSIPYFFIWYVMFKERKRLDDVILFINKEFPHTATEIAPNLDGTEVRYVTRGRVIQEPELLKPQKEASDE